MLPDKSQVQAKMVEDVENRLGQDSRVFVPELFQGKKDLLSNGSHQFVEKPWHRQAAILLAARWSQKDVAKELDKSPAAIAAVYRQPWFQEQVAKLSEKTGCGDVLELLKAEVLGAQQTLVTIMNDENNPPTLRVNVAKDILDRVCGRATQKVEVTNGVKPSSDPVAEVQQLLEEKGRLQDRLGSGSN